MTVGDFYDCLEGFEDARERRMLDIDLLNHIQGQYFAAAFNDPKHYPKSPELPERLKKTNKKLSPMTDDEMLAQIKRDSLQWKGIQNGYNSR